MGTLYFGDNLAVLKASIPDESVDLVYLDPPFNSKATYNVLYKGRDGEDSGAQIEAFTDTWHWGPEASSAMDDVIQSRHSALAEILSAVSQSLGESDMMAYLSMMSVRLIELHKVLKPTGSLYLHCDPTASHYLKLVLDCIFGAENFQNEIIWKRTTTHSDSRTWSRVSDTILFYTKGREFTWNTPIEPHSEEYKDDKYGNIDADGRRYTLDNMTSPSPRPNMMYDWKGFPFPDKGWRYSFETMTRLDQEGRIWYPTNPDGSFDPSRRPRVKRYLDEMPGGVMGNVWTDIPPLNSQAKERLGYPTQKPLALMERIVEASSNEGDVVLDPFCGCGTTVHAAEKLGRRWIGIDVTHLAISLIESRLRLAFPGVEFEVHGTPKDLEGARNLAERDKYQFQWWALSLFGAQPYAGKKKGADKGIDGLVWYKPDGKTLEKAIVSVKGGENIGAAMVRDLIGTCEREKADIGVFVTLVEPTSKMVEEAASAGFVKVPLYHKGKVPRCQIVTIEQLLSGVLPEIPFSMYEASGVVKKPKVEAKGAQRELL